VDGLYVEHLVEKGEVHELVNMGNINEALELYVRQDNWQKVDFYIHTCTSFHIVEWKGALLNYECSLLNWASSHIYL
jgi:hypothetical protein